MKNKKIILVSIKSNLNTFFKISVINNKKKRGYQDFDKHILKSFKFCNRIRRMKKIKKIFQMR